MADTDIETGESGSRLCTISKCCAMDDERACSFNMETGELDVKQSFRLNSIYPRKTKFSIPKELLQRPVETKTRCLIKPNETYSLRKTETYIKQHEDIIFGYNKTSHRLFLIIMSVSLITTRYVAVLGALLEIVLHIWAHRKNSQNKNPKIFYRSPLHIISAQFCKFCLNESHMRDVIKMQDQRNKRFKLDLKNVARQIY